MYALASFGFGFGFRRSKIYRNNNKIICIRQDHVLVDFFKISIDEVALLLVLELIKQLSTADGSIDEVAILLVLELIK